MRWRCSTARVCSAVHNVLSRMTRVEPLISAVIQRSWAPSKANDMKCSSRLPGSISYSSAMACTCMLSGPWATATLFGLPVEPEV
ncbi:hypothetical protein D3C78_1856580 [compost metagenome]